MKKIFNQKIIFAFVLLFLFVPNKGLAYNSNSICRQISNVQSSIQKEHKKVRTETNSVRAERSQAIEKDWQERSKKFNEERSKSDFLYENFMSQLKSRAQTDVEILAVKNFEEIIWSLVDESRKEVDVVWQEYENATLLSLSDQDSLSEKYFKEIENESFAKIQKLKLVCNTKNIPDVKTEMNGLKNLKNKGLAKASLVRKSRLEIAQFAESRDKKIKFIQQELSQKILESYNSLPESLKK